MALGHALSGKLGLMGAILSLSVWGVGCNQPAPHQDASRANASPAAEPASSVAANEVTLQFEHGAQVYKQHCAECHGAAGKGTKGAPALVGPGALPLIARPGAKRSNEFHTAMDIASFATQTMPPDAEDRAALTEKDYWAVLAFALTANGIKLTELVGPHNAGKIVLHP